MSMIDTPTRNRYTCLNMFGISGEHLLILGIVLLFFGPRRLPELGNTLGKAIRNFKDAISGVEEARFRKLPEDSAAQAETAPKTATVQNQETAEKAESKDPEKPQT